MASQQAPSCIGSKGKDRPAIALEPEMIRQCLGVDAVLLPIKAGTKGPSRKGWSQTTFASSQTAQYQRLLKKATAIGVLLGQASGGLCTIDFDDDEFMGLFLEENPRLRETLTTTAKRGCNLWIVMEGPLPPSRNLKHEGRAVGEFRANGRQTLIAGKHPEGFDYRKLVDAPPLHLRYEEIRWPVGMGEGAAASFDSIDDGAPSLIDSSPSSHSSPSLHTLNLLHNIRERQEAREIAQMELEADANLARLYRNYIAKRFTPRQGSRNEDLIKMVTFLHKAVGHARLLELVRVFYRVNQDLFTDPLDQHMREAEAHLNACEQRWNQSLSKDEQQYARNLTGKNLEVFRICRDLAAKPEESLPPDHFFLSCNNLANRLGMHPPEAQRILSLFQTLKLIDITELGTRHSKGQVGRATRFRWLLAQHRP